MKIAAESMPALISSPNTRQRVGETDDSTQTSALSFKIPKWDPIASRKNAAKARLDMLKRQLDGMLKFAGVGKGNVAAAARLAKQIAAAVAEYAGISGDGAVQTPAIAGGRPATPAENTSASKVEAEKIGQAAEQALQKQEEKTDKKTSDPLAALQSKHGMSAQDRDFLEDAKKIMQKAKLLLALELQKSKRDSKTDKSLYNDAIKAMDSTLSKATAALEQAAKQANTPMVYAADGNTTAIQVSIPQISVQV
ncbi:hypothetical protein R6242_20005 [Iodobacter sp. CM08]|uniref:hypothetical protein n=1 Tax=Iodobacter sp. CM08 TaxID=3085902 RepID=UPI0029818B83|nr:hypothetical protein [Iodobacter sp. CM08]MDW5418858.1 hypothetical protein [Iodobacter sp. CM08]